MILEGKKCSISNHDVTALGLTFFLSAKSPKLKMSVGWVEASWQWDWLFQGFVSYFFGELCRLGHLETNPLKPLLFEMHPHFSNHCLHLRKESILSKTSTAQCNSSLLNKYRGHVLLNYLSHKRNIKLIAATQFKGWKYCLLRKEGLKS